MDARRLLAWNLRRGRVRRGLSQEQLAVDAGVNRTYVSGVERAAENPTIEVLERLAKALSMDLADLFAKPGPKEGPPKPLLAGRKKLSQREPEKKHDHSIGIFWHGSGPMDINRFGMLKCRAGYRHFLVRSFDKVRCPSAPVCRHLHIGR
jgi:transcriptional regulator with XRE-family HTH domain